jgi:hypothetical protein
MFLTRWFARERLRTVLLLLPLVSLLLAIWACGFSITSRVGYHPPPVTHRPASQLRMTIQFNGQYAAYGSKPVLMAQVRFFEVSNSNEVSLADKASLTCNGADIKRNAYNAYGIFNPCPLQPPGGAYRITYTDEHGAATTVVVPVPLGAFAILSPRDGVSVPIPTNGAFTVRYATPVPPTNGSVSVNNITVACSVSDAQPCGGVYANLQPNVTPTPGQGMGAATVAPYTHDGASVVAFSAGMGNATPMPVKTPTRGPTPATIPTQSLTPLPGFTPSTGPTRTPPIPYATVTQNGETGTILLHGDYSAFQPAKGFVSLAVEAHVTPDPGNFAAVTASYTDTLHATFTWTR